MPCSLALGPNHHQRVQLCESFPGWVKAVLSDSYPASDGAPLVAANSRPGRSKFPLARVWSSRPPETMTREFFKNFRRYTADLLAVEFKGQRGANLSCDSSASFAGRL